MIHSQERATATSEYPIYGINIHAWEFKNQVHV